MILLTAGTCSVIITVTLIITQWQGALSVNVLESTPPAVNGVLTVCAGQRISLTCSHNNVAIAATSWIASPPVNCITYISHLGISPATPSPCGPFMFQGITPIEPVPPQLNSTAMATATANMTGTNIECRGGNVINNFSVGNISLLVISIVGELWLCMRLLALIYINNVPTHVKNSCNYIIIAIMDIVVVVTIAPTPVVETQLFCVNSSDFITVALSWMVS